MKRLSMLLIAAALLTGTAVKAQTADEIIKKHNDAIGGADAWKKVTSIKYVGSMNMGGKEILVTRTVIEGKGMRQDINIGGMANYMIITPTQGWMFWPIQGQTKPEPMTADMVKETQDEMNVADELIDYAARGAKVEYIGKDDVDGTECFKLKYTNKNGKVSNFFIDPTSYYTIRAVQKMKADGKEQEEVMNMGNYQKLPEGIVVPMSMSGGNGDVKITKVEINTVKDDSIFKPEVGKGG